MHQHLVPSLRQCSFNEVHARRQVLQKVLLLAILNANAVPLNIGQPIGGQLIVDDALQDNGDPLTDVQQVLQLWIY